MFQGSNQGAVSQIGEDPEVFAYRLSVRAVLHSEVGTMVDVFRPYTIGPMRTFSLLLITMLCVTTASAQTPPSARTDTAAVHDQCLLTTTLEEWTALGLSAEQVKEAQAIQTSCKTDCLAVSGGNSSPQALSPVIVEKHRERIRELLGEERYAKWLDLCRKRPADG
jgi:hypothetical protein